MYIFFQRLYNDNEFFCLTLVSTVVIKGGGTVFTISHDNNVKLKCDVSGNDTFEAWKNPNNIVVINNSKVEYNVDGDTHEIKILKVQAKDGGIWTCISKEGNSDTVELHVIGELSFSLYTLYSICIYKFICIYKCACKNSIKINSM